jgi:hypothetical protein
VDEPPEELKIDFLYLLDECSLGFRRQVLPSFEDVRLAGLLRLGDADFMRFGCELDHRNGSEARLAEGVSVGLGR